MVLELMWSLVMTSFSGIMKKKGLRKKKRKKEKRSSFQRMVSHQGEQSSFFKFFSPKKKLSFVGETEMQLVTASRTTDLIAIQTDVGEDVVGTLGDDLHIVLLLSSPVNRMSTLK